MGSRSLIDGCTIPKCIAYGVTITENVNGDYSDVTNATDGGWREISCRKVGPVPAFSGTSLVSSKKRSPLSVRKTCPNYSQNHHHPSSNDWHVEISLPKGIAMPSGGSDLKEFDGSWTSVAIERTADANKGYNVKYDYDPAENIVECSSASDLVSGSSETKHVTVEEDNSASLIGLEYKSATEDIDAEGPRMRERKSLDSTVTDLSSHGMRGCCMDTASELAFIRKQLLEIETKQSNLIDLLQVFSSTFLVALLFCLQIIANKPQKGPFKWQYLLLIHILPTSFSFIFFLFWIWKLGCSEL